MKVTVVMALYNGSRFIIEQMATILNQTRLPDEVYLSDDGSKDNTVELVEQFIQEHNLSDSWQVHINEKNKGYAKNFLDAAMMTTGDIIFFSDQDDLWISDKIKKMSAIMENNEDISLLCSNLEPFYEDEDTRKWSKKELADMKNDGSLEHRSMKDGYFNLGRSGCTMCVRKSFLESIMPYWTKGWAHDDFVWKMASITDSCAVYQYTTIKRRMHSNNTTVIRERTREKRIIQLDETYQQVLSLQKFAQDNRITDKSIEKLLNKNARAVELRQRVLKRRSIISWIKLWLKYKDCYPRIKGLYLDLYLAFKRTYRGV